MTAPVPIRDPGSAQDQALPPRSGRRRATLLAAACAGVVALLAMVGVVARWIAGDSWVDAARLRTATVSRGTLVRDAVVEGRVVAAVSPTLHAPGAGAVSLKVRAGDEVAEGAVVAVVDSPELSSELSRQEALVAQLEAQEGSARIGAERQGVQARRDADEAAIALTAAARELQRADAAWSEGVLSEVERLRARDAVDSARVRERNAAEVARLAATSAAFDLRVARMQLQQQREALSDLRRRVEALVVRAPVSGVIGTLAVDDGAPVAAHAPLMTLVDLSRLEVELEVPEGHAEELGLGMPVEVRFAGERAAGTLSAVSPEVVRDRVLARVRFDGAEPAGMRQGRRVTARILLEERPGVLMVARGPYLEAHGGRLAWVLADGEARRRAIRVGATSVAAVEIEEGLSEGETVVVAGSEAFADAPRVRIRE